MPGTWTSPEGKGGWMAAAGVAWSMDVPFASFLHRGEKRTEWVVGGLLGEHRWQPVGQANKKEDSVR